MCASDCRRERGMFSLKTGSTDSEFNVCQVWKASLLVELRGLGAALDIHYPHKLQQHIHVAPV